MPCSSVWIRRGGRTEGLTLLEITVAVALLTVVMVVAARGLVTYHATLDMQQQRVAAMERCRGILNEMRNVRANNPGNFPDAITDQWPNGAEVGGINILPENAFIVTYTDPDANPLEVTVTCNWVSLPGRGMTVSVTTILTDM